MSSLKPLGDRCVIDPVIPPSIVNGLIIPDMAKKMPNKGKVIAVGKAVEKDDIKLQYDVMFSTYAATNITFENKEMFVVRHADIWAILTADGLLIPLGDRYIIDPVIPPDFAHGLWIPDIAKKPPTQGTVVTMSKLMKKEGISEKDIVTFSSYSASKIEYGSKEMFLVRHHDILAIH